jgi:hypothetical protein
MWKGLVSIRDWVAAGWEGGRRVRAPLLRLRARVSLASGSVLTLLTLFLPIAYEACGPPGKGYEFVGGYGLWPGLLGLVFGWGARGFYVLALGLAAFTLLLVLLSLLRPELLRRSRLTLCLFALAGALSLFVLADFFWVFAFRRIDKLLQWLELSEHVSVATLPAAAFLVLVLCLRSRFLRKQRWIVGLFALAGASCLLLLADFLLSLLQSQGFLGDELAGWMMAAPAFLYWLVPVVLWFRFGLSRRDELRVQWPGIRRRVLQMYVPVAVADGLLLIDVVQMGMWGFLPFFFGLHLISLGYMQLAREAERFPGAAAFPAP